MKLGIGSYTYTWAIGVPGHPPQRPMGALDLVERAAGLGIELVQIADNLPLHALAPRDIARLRTRADEIGITLEIGTRGIEPQHLQSYLRLAQQVGSQIVRVVVDTANAQPSEKEIVTTLRQLMPDFEAANVQLAIENHDRFRAETLVQIIEQVGSDHLGICLDTVNSFGALEGPGVVVPALAPWVVNLHIKDFVVVRAGHQMGFTIEGRPAGQGQLDVPAVLATLHAHGRDPNAVLELWTPPETSIAATLEKEADWAISSVAYLRTLIPD